MSKTKNILKHWLPLALVITAFCALVYASVQQSYRQGANDPQIQMAEDASAALGREESIDSVVPATVVDVGRSLAPFLIVFNDQGEVVASSGQLHGVIPSLPDGVLNYARENGENRITWQPEPGVRIASVVTRYNGASSGFVLAGRSLREAEARVGQLNFFARATWLLAQAASLVLVIFGELFLTKY